MLMKCPVYVTINYIHFLVYKDVFCTSSVVFTFWGWGCGGIVARFQLITLAEDEDDV